MPRPVHRHQARMFLLGVATVAVLGAIAGIALFIQTSGTLPGKPYTYAKAQFADAGMLKPLQDVVQNGVRIGSVDSIEYRDGKALVTLRLDGEKAVWRDARAWISNRSLLAEKQILLDPGTPAAGKLVGRPIPASQTGDSAALDDVLSAFDERTRTALRTSLAELGGGLGGHSKDLRDVVRAGPGMLQDLGDVTGALASREADLPSLLNAADRLAGRFEGREQELGALLEQVDTTFAAINVDGARQLNDTVRALPATLRQAKTGLRALNQPLADMRSAMSTIQPGARALGASSADLRGLLRESLGPLGKVPGVSNRAVPAVEDLTHTVVDASPLVPRLVRTVADARVLLRGLSPYATDISRFFAAHDLLSGRVGPNKHHFTGMVTMPGLHNLSLPDPLVERVPYPEPGGGAWRDTPGSDTPAPAGGR